MQKLVTGLLKSIVHPETGENIVDGGFVETSSPPTIKLPFHYSLRRHEIPLL
jgi:hypothetical protein